MKDQQKYISKDITSALTNIRHNHKTKSDNNRHIEHANFNLRELVSLGGD